MEDAEPEAAAGGPVAASAAGAMLTADPATSTARTSLVRWPVKDLRG
jgi:hypothetical protein